MLATVTCQPPGRRPMRALAGLPRHGLAGGGVARQGAGPRREGEAGRGGNGGSGGSWRHLAPGPALGIGIGPGCRDSLPPRRSGRPSPQYQSDNIPSQAGWKRCNLSIFLSSAFMPVLVSVAVALHGD